MDKEESQKCRHTCERRSKSNLVESEWEAWRVTRDQYIIFKHVPQSTIDGRAGTGTKTDNHLDHQFCNSFNTLHRETGITSYMHRKRKINKQWGKENMRLIHPFPLICVMLRHSLVLILSSFNPWTISFSNPYKTIIQFIFLHWQAP